MDAPDSVTLTITDDEGAAPTLESAKIDGQTLRLKYSEALDETSSPVATAYTVTVNGTDRTPIAAAVSGDVVRVILGDGGSCRRHGDGDVHTPGHEPGARPRRAGGGGPRCLRGDESHGDDADAGLRRAGTDGRGRPDHHVHRGADACIGRGGNGRVGDNRRQRTRQQRETITQSLPERWNSRLEKRRRPSRSKRWTTLSTRTTRSSL